MMKRLIALLLIFMLVGCGSEVSHTTASQIIVEPTTSLSVAVDIADPEVPEVSVPSEPIVVKIEYVPEPAAEIIAKERNVIHIDFSFVGDVMLAEYKGQRTKNGFFDYYDSEGSDWFFDKVKHYFEEDDFTIINVENVFTDNESLIERVKDENPGYWYKAATKYATPLAGASIEVADLNNNHVGDYGTKGRDDTQKILEQFGISTGSYLRPVYFEKDNIVIGMVCAGLWNSYQAEQLTDLVKDVKQKCDICIVYFHGGEMMTYTPDDYKVKGAHNAIDAGADLVVGSHPHCLQPSEVYNDKLIVYSLGNFCYGGTKKPENRTIILKWNIDVDADSKQIVSEGYSFIPCYVYTGSINNYQPVPIEDEEIREAVVDFMYGERSTPFK